MCIYSAYNHMHCQLITDRGKPLFRALGENENSLIRPLSVGVPLGRVLERNNGLGLDAQTFHGWMESGLLRAIDWASAGD